MDLPFSRGEMFRGATGLVACLVLTLVVCVPSAEAKASKLPPGAVKVSPRNVALIAKGVWCGKAPGKWKSYLPGKRLIVRRGKKTTTYFVTALQQARNAASPRQAKRFERTHRRYLKRCRQVEPLRFNLKKAVGVARVAVKRKPGTQIKAAAPESSLQVLLPSGELRDAIESGALNVLGYWVSPNGNLFLEVVSVDLANATPLSEGKGCAFIEVGRASGLPSCVDQEVTGILAPGSISGQEVQFDSVGNVYYAAWVGDPFNPEPTLRRRSTDGQIVELAGGIDLTGFQVLPDRSVLAAGFEFCRPPANCVASSSTAWLKRFTPPPTATEETLLTTASSPSPQLLLNGLSLFPDGNVYFYFAEPGPNIDPSNQRILRYLTSEGRLDPKPWISMTPSLGPTWALQSVCTDGATQASLWPCAQSSNSLNPQPAEQKLYWGNVVNTPNNEAFVAASASFYRAYPSPSILRTTSTVPGVGSPSAEFCIHSIGDTVVFCGGNQTGSSSQEVLALNLSTGVEKILIGPERGLSPYQVGILSNSGRVVFAARQGGGKFMGQIDLASGEVATLRKLDADLIDFLVFGQ